MLVRIRTLQKNKNLIAIIISLIAHCLLFASVEFFVTNNNRYSAIPVELVSMKLYKAKKDVGDEKHTEHEIVKQNISKDFTREDFSSQDVTTKVNSSKGREIEKNSTNGKETIASQSHGNSTDESEEISNNENRASSATQGVIEEKKIKELEKVVVSHKEVPRYPAFSRRMHEEGTVLLLLTVENGAVCAVSVEKSSGFSRLDTAAQEAAKKWRFSTDGNFMVKVPFSFKLSN